MELKIRRALLSVSDKSGLENFARSLTQMGVEVLSTGGTFRTLEAAGIARTDVEGRTLDLHALRHTAATRMARTGVPLMHAQQLLGHSDPKLTAQIYSHLEAEDLRGAVESLPDCVQSSPAADAVDIGRAGTHG